MNKDSQNNKNQQISNTSESVADRKLKKMAKYNMKNLISSFSKNLHVRKESEAERDNQNITGNLNLTSKNQDIIPINSKTRDITILEKNQTSVYHNFGPKPILVKTENNDLKISNVPNFQGYKGDFSMNNSMVGEKDNSIITIKYRRITKEEFDLLLKNPKNKLISNTENNFDIKQRAMTPNISRQNSNKFLPLPTNKNITVNKNVNLFHDFSYNGNYQVSSLQNSIINETQINQKYPSFIKNNSQSFLTKIEQVPSTIPNRNMVITNQNPLLQSYPRKTQIN
jgi:hypothetical protein